MIKKFFLLLSGLVFIATAFVVLTMSYTSEGMNIVSVHFALYMVLFMIGGFILIEVFQKKR